VSPAKISAHLIAVRASNLAIYFVGVDGYHPYRFFEVKLLEVVVETSLEKSAGAEGHRVKHKSR
jgi:hypothetical protein